jgi:hypothetical protein
MMRALFRVPSVVADYTVGTVIVFVHALRQDRRSRAPRLTARS